MKKKDVKIDNPHFVKEIDYTKKEPWRTDVIFGQKGKNSHGHLALSGADVWIFRDEKGENMVINGQVNKYIEDLKPTPKEKNLFWASVSINVAIGIITGLVSGLIVKGQLTANEIILLILLSLALIIVSIFAKKQIVSVKGKK